MTDEKGVRAIVYTPAEVSGLVLEAVEERRGASGAGIRLGIKPVDRELLPLRPGELVTVTSRPGHYKSGLMQFWARNIARDLLKQEKKQEVVVFVTWEMAIEEIGLYDLAAAVKIDAAELAQGRIDDEGLEKLRGAAMRRASIPLWLVGHSIKRRKKRTRLTLSNVARALMWIEDKMAFHPRIIFLDYLQQMETERRKGQEIARRLDIFENVHRCKDMALAMGCPVVLGVQAGRQVDGREWKLPQMGDQQESSNVEQTADKMLSLWYPSRSLRTGTEIQTTDLFVEDNLLILGLVKQRLGPAGMWWPLYVDPARNEVAAMAREEELAF